MLMTASETETPRLTVPSLDEARQSWEKAANLWVGASLPLWAPFFAAASVGIGAWAVVRTWQRGEDLARQLPLAGGWLKSDLLPESVAETVDTTVALATEAAETVEPIVTAVGATVTQTVEAPAVMAAEIAETVEPVAEAVAVSPVLDPVTEAPVVPAVVEAIAEPAVPEVVATAAPEVAEAVEPKPLAKDLAVAKSRPAPRKPKAN